MTMENHNLPASHEYITNLMDRYNVPGLSITVYSNDSVESMAFGVASRNSGTLCSIDTLFDIASCSKSLTAGMVALLVNDDENYPHIQWNTPVAAILPGDFIMPTTELTRGVTVEDILSHRTGMASHDFSYLGPSAMSPDNPKTVTRNLRNLSVAAPLRSKFIYNNMMYTVAVHLIEHVTGFSFSDILQQRILGPLGMDSTYLQPSSAIAAGQGDRIATGHHSTGENGEWRDFPAWNAPEAVGAGSIITTSEDYIKWVQALLYLREPVSAEIYAALTKPRTLITEDVEDLEPGCSPYLYALGFEVHWYRGYQVVMHDGLVAGFGGTVFFVPSVKFGACIFGNATEIEDVVFVLSRALTDAAIDLPHALRPDWIAFLDEKNAKMDHERESGEEELRARLGNCDDVAEERMVSTPSFERFAGQYWNAGYHFLTVGVEDDALSIDATDRSFPAVTTFEPIRSWRTDDSQSIKSSFIAHMIDSYEGSDEHIGALFEVLDGRATRMGLELEKTCQVMG